MGDRRSTRRTSARLMEKEDALQVNGAKHESGSGKTNGASAKAGKGASDNTGRAKRKLHYDEEDDGFMFSRTRSKRSKGAQAPKIPEPVVEDEPEPPKAAPARKTRKKSVETADAEKEDAAPRRRSARHSADKNNHPLSELEVPKRKSKEPPEPKPKKAKTTKKAQEEPNEDRMDLVGDVSRTPVHNLEASTDGTKIALPFADTPIIRRNKELRKGERRSSLGMRGRRASSLIDSGSNALPHAEVESAEFYKHIEPGQLEPRRMRQLLTWCGTRALGDKPSFATEDSHAKLAAREIQQQLLADFGNRSELSDWFNREEAPVRPETLKPNPRNTANESKIEDLEKQLARLRTERETWEQLLKPPSDPYSIPPLPEEIPNHKDINPSSLTSTDTEALSVFHGTATSTTEPVSLQANIRARLSTITGAVEFETDKLADSVHVLTQHMQGAERVSSGLLSACAKALEQRDHEAAQRQDGDIVGARDVLRALSRALER